jgi:hypothetical protein
MIMAVARVSEESSTKMLLSEIFEPSTRLLGVLLAETMAVIMVFVVLLLLLIGSSRMGNLKWGRAGAMFII